MMANHLDSFFTLILPFCAITFLNVRITLCVWQLKGQRKTIVAVAHLNRSNSAASTSKTRILIGQNPRNGIGPGMGQTDSVNGEEGGGGRGSGGGLCGSAKCKQTHSHRQLQNRAVDARKTRGQGSSASPGSSAGNPSSSAAEVRVTKTLLLVSTVFLVLNLPSHAIRAFAFVEVSKQYEHTIHPSHSYQVSQNSIKHFST